MRTLLPLIMIVMLWICLPLPAVALSVAGDDPGELNRVADELQAEVQGLHEQIVSLQGGKSGGAVPASQRERFLRNQVETLLFRDLTDADRRTWLPRLEAGATGAQIRRAILDSPERLALVEKLGETGWRLQHFTLARERQRQRLETLQGGKPPLTPGGKPGTKETAPPKPGLDDLLVPPGAVVVEKPGLFWPTRPGETFARYKIDVPAGNYRKMTLEFTFTVAQYQYAGQWIYRLRNRLRFSDKSGTHFHVLQTNHVKGNFAIDADQYTRANGRLPAGRPIRIRVTQEAAGQRVTAVATDVTTGAVISRVSGPGSGPAGRIPLDQGGLWMILGAEKIFGTHPVQVGPVQGLRYEDLKLVLEK